MIERPTEQELNAYVDGELAPRDVARVARAIALDSTIASRVATLTRLKSAMAVIAEDSGGEIDLPRSVRSPGYLAIAASVALFFAVAIAWMSGIGPFGSNENAWFEEARKEHAAWAVNPANPNAREVEANLHLVNLDRFGLPFQTPDLTSAKLRLTYEHFYKAKRTAPNALHLGYTGRRGCKVTLWVTRAPEGLGTRLTEVRQDKVRGFRWRVGDTAYALFATGMEEQRLNVIAKEVFESTRRMRGFDERTRTALNEASTGIPPCQA